MLGLLSAVHSRCSDFRAAEFMEAAQVNAAEFQQQ